MAYTTQIIGLLLVPLLICLLCFASHKLTPSKSVPTVLHIIGLVGLIIFIIQLISGLALQHGEIIGLDKWFHLDYLGALFLAILGLIALMTGIYSIGYMNREYHEQTVNYHALCNYYAFFHLFIFTMLIAIVSNNVILMWVAIEATTLSSAFLVGLYRKKSSLEAAWKYVIICSVGVAFGLYGTILVYANGANVLPNPDDALFWTELIKYPQLLDGRLMQLAFVFVVIGFGTKMGLFPMHAWLPDAHSEAPSPASALLSAVLLNCAFLIVLRFYILISAAIGTEFPSTLLLVFGMLSVAVAAFLIIVQKDIKRLLAYSSVENMGLIAVAIGIGGPLGVLAALLHTINHSLAKALLFCGSGNILLKYGSRDMGIIRGMLKVAPLSAVLIAGGALGLAGVPPFNVFLSEFMIVTAGVSAGRIWLVIVLLLLLTVVLGGLVRMVAKILFGEQPEKLTKGDLGAWCVLPIGILLILMLLMGTLIPQSVSNLLEQASTVVLKQTEQNIPVFEWPWGVKSTTSISHTQDIGE